ncbi:MAG: hypothetical protein AAFO29_24100, partial [Actinomycetota bacterium]
MSTTFPTDPTVAGSDPEAGHDPAAGAGAAAPAIGRGRRLFHHLAVAVVLAAVLPLAGTNAVWSADEGALLYQATAVAEGEGWTFDHPFPAADPEGSWFPIHLSSFAADGGYVVLGKHTVLVRLVGAVHGLGGYPAVLALSVLAAFVTAAATARLARRLDRAAELPALWLAGVASPLFLSAYVAWAHTLAAALVAWSLLGLTTRWSGPWSRGQDHSVGSDPGPPPPSTERPSRRRLTVIEIGAALALGLSCLLRTEATLAAIALTLTLLGAALLYPPATIAAAGGRSSGTAAPEVATAGRR